MKSTIGAVAKATVLFGGLGGLLPSAAKAAAAAVGCPSDPPPCIQVCGEPDPGCRFAGCSYTEHYNANGVCTAQYSCSWNC